MAMIVSLRGITKSYGEKTVLRGVDLSLDEGKSVMINGASGCGKSTLLNIIGLLDHFDGGEYRFSGKSITQKQVSGGGGLRGAEIGFVFQSYYLIDSLSAYDNAVMPFLYNKKTLDAETKKHIYSYFEGVGLAEAIHRRAADLSGGEKQRVAIIRALVSQPRLVIADEPTGNLDADNTRVVIDLLKAYAAEGHSVLTVSHNYELREQFDSCYRLENGVLCHE